MRSSSGIHHITAIASNPKTCVDFYTRILGLRLVKKSVNQDQVEAYHLFFGDTTGEPGMDVTFFTFPGISQGKRGAGSVTKISLSVPVESLEFWQQRFKKFKVKQEAIHERFGLSRLVFYDFDDQRLELVGIDKKVLKASQGEVWTTPEITLDQAIRCFYSATLSVLHKNSLELICTQILGFVFQNQAKSIELYQLPSQHRAAHLEIEEDAEQELVINAAGTVHHIAFQVADETELNQQRQQLLNLGLYPTEVIDRYYFKSVYFRTPAGILFELATLGPGFTVDESKETLGQTLALPPFLESYRQQIEAGLEPI